MSKNGRVLIVDDDPRICRTISRYLEVEGYSVKYCGNSTVATELLRTFLPDLVLLDLNLPDGNGLDIARTIRSFSNIGIIVISGTIEQVDKILSLELGADDFLSKPLNLREVLARIRTVMRRTKLHQELATSEALPAARVITFDGWTLNLNNHELTSPQGELVPLTSHEFKFLSLLANNSNRVLNRDQILESLGQKQWSPLDRSIDVMIGKLRRKLSSVEKDYNPILTIRGEGYKFVGN